MVYAGFRDAHVGFRDAGKTGISQDIPGYPGITQYSVYPMITRGNTGQHWAARHNPPKISLSFFSVGKTTG